MNSSADSNETSVVPQPVDLEPDLESLRAELRAVPRETLIAAIQTDPETAGIEPTLAALARRLRSFDAETVFSYIYAENLWGSPESRSGTGSSLFETAAIRAALPPLLLEYRIESLLDIPCGDFAWMKILLENPDLAALDYTGADIVPDLIARNQAEHAGLKRRFIRLDLARDPLPPADLILCRDCLVHLPFAMIRAALANIKRSGARWLLTTTFPVHRNNVDIAMGNWRPLNLAAPPFSLPPAQMSIDEQMPDPLFADKTLAMWRVADLPD